MVFQIFDLSKDARAKATLQATLACHASSDFHALRHDPAGAHLSKPAFQRDDWFFQPLSACTFTKRIGGKPRLAVLQLS